MFATKFIIDTKQFWQQCQNTVVRFDERNEMHDKRDTLGKGREMV